MADTGELYKLIAAEAGVELKSAANALQLFEEGATIPFVARYRKERTGGLDELQLGAVSRAFKRLQDLDRRKAYILETISAQGKLTDALRDRIVSSWDATEIEDLYLPFKSKRKTRADKARELGLEPLAKLIMSQPESAEPLELARRFVGGKVKSIDDALKGARDIIAEWINEKEQVRQIARSEFRRSAFIYSRVSRGKKEEAGNFSDYFDFSEKLLKAPSHRLLAMFRGENLGLLKLTILPDVEKLLNRLEGRLLKGRSRCAMEVEEALRDAWKRLLQPSMETEFRKLAKERADEEAISIFAANLRQLLLAPPLGPGRILALDPAFRTGCKTVCLSESGDLLWHGTVFPHPPQNKVKEASQKLPELVRKYKIQAVAVGNGTAGKETVEFIKSIPELNEMEVYLVNEAGASIYSASAVAVEEFPDLDLTVRGAVSIGRRLMDPLAELVKLEPRHIGVGQYQHDVDQKMLNERLREVVEFCVNQVGVNLHTASRHLLTYISGLGPGLARAIVDYRSSNGKFRSRAELKKVAGLGPRAYQQCAGFLRLPGAANPLDNTGVHPERYDLVKQMATDQGLDLVSFIERGVDRKSIRLTNYTDEEVGVPTLTDILNELEKPGLDPRGRAEEVQFSNIRSIEDLQPGMKVHGLVSNLAKFGAFVDLGIKESGLIHISEMADRFVSNPSEVLQLGQQVEVRVLDVDVARKRISLSLKEK